MPIDKRNNDSVSHSYAISESSTTISFGV